MDYGFNYNPGGRRIESVAISPELLKEVYQMSRFNVTLQAKVQQGLASEYRAFCTHCGADLKISYEQLLEKNRNNQTWTWLKDFCSDHSHGGVLTATTEGRKFRDVHE